jgi:hypothetical protein
LIEGKPIQELTEFAAMNGFVFLAPPAISAWLILTHKKGLRRDLSFNTYPLLIEGKPIQGLTEFAAMNGFVFLALPALSAGFVLTHKKRPPKRPFF